MYQLGTKWKLWDLQNFLADEVQRITLRGYKEEQPVLLPSDFYMLNLQGRRFRGLSVGQIASGFCPTQRDLYLEKAQGIRISRTNKTWGSITGHLIEQYCMGILDYFRDFANNPGGLNYQLIQSLAEEYSQNFWRHRGGKINELQEKAKTSLETPERLMFLLQQTAKYELTMLGADYLFSNTIQEFIPLLEGIPIKFDQESVKIYPHTNLGLSEFTTPDFIIFEPEIVMGDVKSGPHIEPKYLHTITGYALAYESQHQTDVNFGVVYFFETHTEQLNFAQSYVFVISDVLRRGFLDKRNQSYKTLQAMSFPPLADREKHCQYCKYLSNCYPETNG